jgi:hypothetical protein
MNLSIKNLFTLAGICRYQLLFQNSKALYIVFISLFMQSRNRAYEPTLIDQHDDELVLQMNVDMPIIVLEIYPRYLVEKPKNLSSNMFPPSFLVIHNPRTSGKDNISNTSCRQELIDPCFQIGKTDVESRRNDSALVETSVELNDNLTRTVIINFLEFSNIA